MNGGARSRVHRLSILWFVASACQESKPPTPRADLENKKVAEAVACRDNASCDADSYCVYEPGLCARGRASGSCQRKQAACDHPAGQVCGCDGKVYADACTAQRAGVDLDVTGRCRESVPGHAACGAHYCDARTSYCEIYLSDVFELPTRHSCRPLPAACRAEAGEATKTCACFLPETPCLSFCGPMLTGPSSPAEAAPVLAFHLTCQGVHEPAR